MEQTNFMGTKILRLKSWCSRDLFSAGTKLFQLLLGLSLWKEHWTQKCTGCETVWRGTKLFQQQGIFGKEMTVFVWDWSIHRQWRDEDQQEVSILPLPWQDSGQISLGTVEDALLISSCCFSWTFDTFSYVRRAVKAWVKIIKIQIKIP